MSFMLSHSQVVSRLSPLGLTRSQEEGCSNVVSVVVGSWDKDDAIIDPKNFNLTKDLETEKSIPKSVVKSIAIWVGDWFCDAAKPLIAND